MSGGGRRRERKDKPKVDDSKPPSEEVVFIQWEHVSLEQIQILLKKKTTGEIQSELQQVLLLQNPHVCVKEAVVLDWLVCGLMWAKSIQLDPTQTSFTMAVLQLLLDNITDKHMTLVDNMLVFTKALAPACCPCATPTGNNAPLLSTEQATAFTAHVENSVFQKHRLHQLLFTADRDQHMAAAQRTLEVWPCHHPLTPLEEGIPAHWLP